VGGRSIAFYPNRVVLREVIDVNMSHHPLLVVSRRRPLVSGVAEFNMAQKDLIVYPTSLPRLNVDLGARSLVSGVDCNDPEKSPILELLVILFFCVIVSPCIFISCIFDNKLFC
jgi:hypothetical protein